MVYPRHRNPLTRALTGALSAAIVCAALLVSAAPAHAQGASSAGEAAAMVKSRSGARVLNVRTEGQGPRRTYRVKILTPKGVVRVVTVPHRRR